ncbi:MAG TPA: hypothetical protein VIA45_10440 [Thermoanaerobaculia bacterium]
MSASVEELPEELIEGQRARLLEIARRIAPEIAADDLLQPHDHPDPGNHLDFPFEHGILAGYLAVRAALRANR